jgi:hypothetical protein
LKAGLRAAEIANLSWDMVVDPTGKANGAISSGKPAHNGDGPHRTTALRRNDRAAAVDVSLGGQQGPMTCK